MIRFILFGEETFIMTNNSKILIVDDESIVTNTLKNVLALEGFEDVEFFNNPLEAIEFLKENNVALIISDFLMPQMNGIEFLRETKKYVPNASKILLTGYSDKENAIKAINEVGLYKYIEKPWDNDILLLSIKNGIERSQLICNLESKINELEQANYKIEKYSHSLEDMVEAKTASLSESNEKLSAIINFCADGILTIDHRGTVLQVNQAFETMTGLDESFLIGNKLDEILHFAKYENLDEKLGRVQEFFLRDVSIKNSLSNREIFVEISFAPIINSNENTNTFVCVIRNIQLQKELDRLRDDFIATLTHDLRTPLLASIQALEFFIDGSLGKLEDRQLKILETMKTSNEDILGLVNALLEVYKYESGRINLYKSDFKINELVKFVAEELSPLATKKSINFEFDIDDTDGVEIFADKNELRRVITNLSANAITHNKRGCTVTFRTKLQNNDLLVSIKDNGEGISKNDIPKMFQRFSQLSDQRVSVGTGLGLYLSRQIVEAHNGKIWIESDKNRGSEFFFLLPECAKCQALK